jgi:hypothetical protein
MTSDEIVADFPELTLNHVRAALQFAAMRERRLGMNFFSIRTFLENWSVSFQRSFLDSPRPVTPAVGAAVEEGA